MASTSLEVFRSKHSIPPNLQIGVSRVKGSMQIVNSTGSHSQDYDFWLDTGAPLTFIPKWMAEKEHLSDRIESIIGEDVAFGYRCIICELDIVLRGFTDSVPVKAKVAVERLPTAGKLGIPALIGLSFLDSYCAKLDLDFDVENNAVCGCASINDIFLF